MDMLRRRAVGATVAVLAGCAQTVGGDTLRGGPACPAALDGNGIGALIGPRTEVYVTSAQWRRDVALPDATGCGPDGGGGLRLLVRYVPRADSFLSVTIARDATAGEPSPPIVGRLLLLDGCGAGARRLACEGRSQRALRLDELPGPLVSPTRVAAGRAVVIAAVGDATDATLTITEIATERALGDPCDPAQHADRCPVGSTCAGAVEGECVPDGAEGARCRRGGAPCEPGLSCFFATRDGSPGQCLRRVVPGAPCAFGERCLEGRCDPARRCRDLGVDAGPCRATEPRCDPGLSCRDVGAGDAPRCVRAIADGERCAEGATDLHCAQGASCVDVGDVLRCVRDGATGGRCRGASPACGDGLRCRGGRCVQATPPAGEGAPCRDDAAVCGAGLWCDGARCLPRAAVGASCAPDAGQSCVAGASCVRAGDASSGRCVPHGARGGMCRGEVPACDAGLLCAAGRRCLPATALRGRCGGDGACVGGARCADTCRANGAEGGWCRSATPRCDAGLACVQALRGEPPRCVRALADGAPCRPVDDTAVACPDQSLCTGGGDDGRPRCVARTTPVRCTADVGGPAVCPPGTGCARGLCHTESPALGGCGDAVPCARGSSCVPRRDPHGGADCIPDGGDGAPCDLAAPRCGAGFECAPQPGRAAACKAVSREGAACAVAGGPRCASGLTCVDPVCRAHGSDGAACRTGDAPCDRGLRCDGLRCTAAPPTRGAPCSASMLCEASLACAAARGEPARCGDGAYVVSLRRGAPPLGACGLPVRSLTTPMSVPLFGVPHEVVVSPEGQLRLVSPSPGPPGSVRVTLRGVQEAVALDNTPPTWCARVVGEAPRRRVVLSHLEGEDNSLSEVSLAEGTGVVEFSLRQPRSAGATWWTRVSLASAGSDLYIAPAVPDEPGVAITLTPR